MATEEEQEFQQAKRLIDARRVYVRQPKSVGQLAGKVIGRNGVAAEQSVHELEAAWKRISGPQFANQTQVGTVRRNKLEITVANSLINQQLAFEKKRLLALLNRELANGNIHDIIFRVGTVP